MARSQICRDVDPPIPLCEPVLGGRELEYITRCIDTGWVSSNGEFVVRMEDRLSKSPGLGTRSPATPARRPSISPCCSRGHRRRRGDRATVTFIATANVVRYVGALPVSRTATSTVTWIQAQCGAFSNKSAWWGRRYDQQQDRP